MMINWGDSVGAELVNVDVMTVGFEVGNIDGLKLGVNIGDVVVDIVGSELNT
jgi:hypothetical protein